MKVDEYVLAMTSGVVYGRHALVDPRKVGTTRRWDCLARHRLRT